MLPTHQAYYLPVRQLASPSRQYSLVITEFARTHLTVWHTYACGNCVRLTQCVLGPYKYMRQISVSGQFRCARYKCGISACKQSNLCCYDGFCTNLCCANDIVILTGPREQNRGIWVGLKLKATNYEKYDTKTKKMTVVPPGE